MSWNSISLIFLLSMPGAVYGQADTTSTIANARKLKLVSAGAAATYTLALLGLNEAWYSNNERTSFHFFNDNAEWKQVDKLGHFYSAFHISAASAGILKSMKVRPNKADVIGALTAFGVLLPIEILDGRSKAYGASLGDLTANTAGAGFYLLQRRVWSEVRIHPKLSFQRTDYAALRPDVLGDGFAEELLKDYNGQTQWLSVDMDKFVHFPKWLNVAMGYGAQGMVYARDYQNSAAGYSTAFRQYYIGLDWDLTAIPTKSKAMRTLLFIANMVRLPAPALAMSRKGIRFHPFYF